MPKKMTPDRRQVLKEKLIKGLMEQVDAYLDWYENVEDLKFRDIEQQVLETRKEMGVQLAEAIVAEESIRITTAMRCPICGGKLRKKGRKEKRVVSLAGEVKVERDYIYCSHCQRGFFPPRSKYRDERWME